MVCRRPRERLRSTQSSTHGRGVWEKPANMAGFSRMPRAHMTPRGEREGGGRERGREKGGRGGGGTRERGRDGGRERGRKGGRERGRKGGREGETDGGGEGKKGDRGRKATQSERVSKLGNENAEREREERKELRGR